MFHVQYWRDTNELQCEGEFDPTDPAHVDPRLEARAYPIPPDLTVKVWSVAACDYVDRVTEVPNG